VYFFSNKALPVIGGALFCVTKLPEYQTARIFSKHMGTAPSDKKKVPILLAPIGINPIRDATI